jgi:hypothetical protein
MHVKPVLNLSQVSQWSRVDGGFVRPGEVFDLTIHYDGKNIEKSTGFSPASFFALFSIKATF